MSISNPALTDLSQTESESFGWLGKTLPVDAVRQHQWNSIKTNYPGLVIISYYIARLLPWLNFYYLCFGTVLKSDRELSAGKAGMHFIASILLAIIGAAVIPSVGNLALVLHVPLVINCFYIVNCIAVLLITNVTAEVMLHTWHLTPVAGYKNIPDHIMSRTNQNYDKTRAEPFVLWFGIDPFLVLVEQSSWKPMFMRKKVYIGAWDTGTWMDNQ